MYLTNSFCILIEVILFFLLFIVSLECRHTEKRNALLIVGNSPLDQLTL